MLSCVPQLLAPSTQRCRVTRDCPPPLFPLPLPLPSSPPTTTTTATCYYTTTSIITIAPQYHYYYTTITTPPHHITTTTAVDAPRPTNKRKRVLAARRVVPIFRIHPLRPSHRTGSSVCVVVVVVSSVITLRSVLLTSVVREKRAPSGGPRVRYVPKVLSCVFSCLRRNCATLPRLEHETLTIALDTVLKCITHTTSRNSRLHKFFMIPTILRADRRSEWFPVFYSILYPFL